MIICLFIYHRIYINQIEYNDDKFDINIWFVSKIPEKHNILNNIIFINGQKILADTDK